MEANKHWKQTNTGSKQLGTQLEANKHSWKQTNTGSKQLGTQEANKHWNSKQTNTLEANR
jgi:hypothetical protein